jgi:uncharacterized protein YqhQ
MSATEPLHRPDSVGDAPFKPLDVGGQAVLEGVMMRGPKSMVIAVRRPDGTILVKDDEWIPFFTRYPILKTPFVRGAAVLIESLINGMQALSFSAEIALEEEDEEDEAGEEDGNVADLAAARAARDDEKADKPSGVMTTGAIALSLATSFVLGIILFIFVPHWTASVGFNLVEGLPLLTEGQVERPLFHAVVGMVKMLVFVSYIVLIARMPDIRRVFQYHGAEHKSIWTYESGDELTVENARKYPVQHPRCGTSFLVFVIMISIGFFAAVFPLIVPFLPDVQGWRLNLLQAGIKIPMMIPIAGISYEFIKWAGKYRTNPVLKFISWPGLLVQNLTTREPDDDQLEVALVSIKRTLEHEGRLTNPDYNNVEFQTAATA